MDPHRWRRLRRLAVRAYFCLLFALAGIVAWDAVLGARHGGRTAPEQQRSTNAARELSCDTQTLPRLLGDLREASGLALSRRTPGMLWSMNDSDDPVVVALTTDGETAGRVRITGATVTDWEDVSVGPCADGSCLYVGDIGDIHGEGKRLEVTLYRVPEPAPGDAASAKAVALVLDYPDRGHDAEASFVSPDGTIFIITKGHPTELFRVPSDARPGTAATLVHVATLPTERFLDDKEKGRSRITDAEISPDGKWVAMRTNVELLLYRTRDLIAGRSDTVWHADLRSLDETQGEGVAITNDGDIYLAGEGGGHGLPGTFARIHCVLPAN